MKEVSLRIGTARAADRIKREPRKSADALKTYVVTVKVMVRDYSAVNDWIYAGLPHLIG